MTKYPLLFFFLISGLFIRSGYAQQTYSFTTAGATGSVGPNQGQVNTAYASTNLNGNVVVTGQGIQTWTVPLTGLYAIDASGASGGSSTVGALNAGGLGSRMVGDFLLTQGDVIRIVVGQRGRNSTTATGGGGTYVTRNNVLLITAGGGGGASSDNLGAHSVTLTSGTNDNPGGPSAGGTNGSGGLSCLSSVNGAGGGGGYSTNGANGTGNTSNIPNGGGISFLNGSLGGYGEVPGSFGGSGGVSTLNYGGASGGGGYSGGAGGQQSGTCVSGLSRTGGGGGGSYNSGTNQVNTGGVVSGDGLVLIRELCNITLTANGPFVNNAICAGNSVTLSTSAVSNYSWSTGATSSVLVVSPNVTTTYSLGATSPSNCTAYAAITITVNGTAPSLTVVNTASNSAGICPNSTVNLLASGALTYTWAGGTQSVSNGVTFSPTLAATYTVTGANGCGTSSAATSVSVHPLPVVTPVASSNSLCSGSNLTLTAQGNAATYTWTGGSVSFTNGIGFVPATSTIYTLSGTSALNCTAMATIPITVYVTPTLVPTAAPAIVCIGGSSTLSASGALNYTWSSGSQTVNTNTFVVTPSGPGITTYTITKSNSNCSDTKTISITTNSLPTVAAIVMPTTICALSQATLAAGGALTYTWTAPGTPNFTFTGATNVISTPVPATYSVAASDGTCVNTATVFLNTNPNPTISASSSATNVCEGSSVNLNASGASNYTWTTGTGTFYTASITDTPTGPTAYQVTGDNAFGCTAQANLIVLVSQSPTLSAGPDKNLICSGSAVTFTVSGASTYTWDANAGNATGVSVVVNPTNTLSGPVVYTVSGTNTIGCISTRTTFVQVYIPTLSVSGNTNACKDGTIQLTASGANSGSYSWNTGSGTPIAGASLNTSLSTPAIFTVSANTTSLSVTCPVSQTIQADLYPDPSITATAERTTICAKESVELYAGGGNSYLWNNGASGATISVSPQIQTNYTVTGTDANGCKNTATVQVRVGTCTGIDERGNTQNGLVVYPNPNTGTFTIRGVETDLKLILVNELGQLIQHIELSAGNNYQADVKDLSKGIYFIKGQGSGHGSIHQKVIVTR
jgi:hypothetical protein